MACVAERQVTALQVNQANKEGDKHAVLVFLARHHIVHLCAYLRGLHTLIGQHLEEFGGLRHKQRGRHTLAAHVAQAEVQLVAVQHIAVEVAAHLAGRFHGGIHV